MTASVVEANCWDPRLQYFEVTGNLRRQVFHWNWQILHSASLCISVSICQNWGTLGPDSVTKVQTPAMSWPFLDQSNQSHRFVEETLPSLRLSQALCYGIHQILWCQQRGRTHIGGELSDLRIKKKNGWKYCDVWCQMAGSTQRSHIRAFGDLPRPPVGHSLPAPQKEQDWHVANCEIVAIFLK